jgi:hypothetical protein
MTYISRGGGGSILLMQLKVVVTKLKEKKLKFHSLA